LVRLKSTEGELQLDEDSGTSGGFYFVILSSSSDPDEELDGLRFYNKNNWAVIYSYSRAYDKKVCESLKKVHDDAGLNFIVQDEVSEMSVLKFWKDFLKDRIEADFEIALQRVSVNHVNLPDMERTAQEFMRAGEWLSAVAAYKQIIGQSSDPEAEAAWQKALERCEEETLLADLFVQGRNAMRRLDWQEAQDTFLKLINHRPAYQKDDIRATTLLEQTIKKGLYISLPPPLPFF